MTNGIQQEVIEWAIADRLPWRRVSDGVNHAEPKPISYVNEDGDRMAVFYGLEVHLKPASAWDVVTKFGLVIHLTGSEPQLWEVYGGKWIEVTDPDPLRAVELALVALYNREVGSDE